MLHPSFKNIKKNKKKYIIIYIILTDAKAWGIVVLAVNLRKEGIMNLQERMIEYRARERITQVELAERCGVSVQTVCAVENGHQDPGKVTLAKIELVVGKEEQ